jgi:hypothetical protein
MIGVRAAAKSALGSTRSESNAAASRSNMIMAVAVPRHHSSCAKLTDVQQLGEHCLTKFDNHEK